MNIYGIVASIFLCTLAFNVITCADAVAGPSAINTKRNSNFVEVIKQDLKRNNDDYKELAAFTTKPTYVAVKQVPVSFDNKRIIIKSNTKTFRRMNDKSYENYDFVNNTLAKNNKTNNNLIPKMNKRVGKLQPGLNFLPILGNQSTIRSNKKVTGIYSKSFTETQKPLTTVTQSVNRMKIDKLFKENNKELLLKHLRHRIYDITTRKMNLELSINHNLIEKIKENAKKYTVGDNDGELPNPEVLDMAPAKGGRIHRQRVKDRLCFRHVLLPEGPKYDSGGRVYLPAHAVAAGARLAHDYTRTRPPTILLPRCCNCCKKSVLGCE